MLSDAVAFLRMTFLGFVFVFGYLAFQAPWRGIGVVYTPMYIVLGTVLLNFLLDPLFIFGYGPFPASAWPGRRWPPCAPRPWPGASGYTS